MTELCSKYDFPQPVKPLYRVSEQWATGDDEPEATRPAVAFARVSGIGSGDSHPSCPPVEPLRTVVYRENILLQRCISQSIHHLHLYRSLHSNI